MSNVEIPFCFFHDFSILFLPNNQRQLQKRKFDFIHTWAIMGATGRYHCLTFRRFIRSRISWLSGTASKERCPKALGPNSCRPAKKPKKITASQNYRKIDPLEESWHFCWNMFFVIQAYQSHVLSGHVFTKFFHTLLWVGRYEPLPNLKLAALPCYSSTLLEVEKYLNNMVNSRWFRVCSNTSKFYAKSLPKNSVFSGASWVVAYFWDTPIECFTPLVLISGITINHPTETLPNKNLMKISWVFGCRKPINDTPRTTAMMGFSALPLRCLGQHLGPPKFWENPIWGFKRFPWTHVFWKIN